MQWYYARDGEQVGPLTEHQFEALVAKGDITAETLVWHANMDNWAAYKTLVPETKAAPGPRPPNRLRLASNADETETSNAETADVVAIAEDDTEAFISYGGFWIRFVAKFIDSIILGIVYGIVGFAGVAAMAGLAANGSAGVATIVSVTLFVLQIAIVIGYSTFFNGKYGATPGKMVFRLRIVRPDGSPIGYGVACGRFFAELLSGMIFDIGYIMAGFDEEKRALHDRLCNTRVIRG